MPEILDKLYAGKAKTLFRTRDPDRVVVLFRNDTSAFDGKKVEQLTQKGSVNNYFNAFIMQKLASVGIETHFDRLLDAERSLVKTLKMIPVECVVRNKSAGSLCRRLGIEEGRDLAPPTFEFFLKNDALGDPMINESHIETFGWADRETVQTMKAVTFKINQVLKPLFADAGLWLVDYKLEFGLFQNKVVLGDEFTPDGCRLWDIHTGAKLDKDRFRQGLGQVVESYLEVARRLGVPEL